MTNDELEAHKRALIEEERRNPPRWWYLSYASDEGFRGVVIVQGQGFVEHMPQD